MGCDFAVTLRNLKVVLLSEGQFSPLLPGGISALIFFDRLSPEPTDSIVFYCIKPPVLLYSAFWTHQVVGNLVGSGDRKLLGLPAVPLPG